MKRKIKRERVLFSLTVNLPSATAPVYSRYERFHTEYRKKDKERDKERYFACVSKRARVRGKGRGEIERGREIEIQTDR